MFDTLIHKLENLGCDGWELNETRTEGWEFYFIRHKLDQNRVTDVKTVSVKVFRLLEDGKYLGSASGEISPTASEEEMDKILADLLFQAGLVKNPAYTLNDEPLTGLASGQAPDPAEIAEAFIRAMKDLPETAAEDINSYEIFVRRNVGHFRNSNGVEVVCVWPDSMLEVVINARNADHEIELYRNLTSGTCDRENLAQEVARAMRFGHDRLMAVPTPRITDIPVVFSTSDAVSIYEYFVDRMSAGYKVQKMTPWEIGEPIVGEKTAAVDSGEDGAAAAGEADTENADDSCRGNAENTNTTDSSGTNAAEEYVGDRISVEALSSLPGSSRDVPVDSEGARIRDRYLIRDGVAENFWGNRQFSQYLGLKDSSQVYNVRVSGGTRSAEEIRQGDYLELVEFSDFQVDSMGGDIAGEIRLGYLHRGGEVMIVTGGSVTGSMTEAMATMQCSKEQKQYDTFVIPAVTKLFGLRITPAVSE